MHHLLEIDSIIKNFGTRQLLTDVYLKINTGDVIGLFGRNGTGKNIISETVASWQPAGLSGMKTGITQIQTASCRPDGS